jgi:hypothetical protein
MTRCYINWSLRNSPEALSPHQNRCENLGFQTSQISLICDKSVTTQNLAFLSYWYRKKRLQIHF